MITYTNGKGMVVTIICGYDHQVHCLAMYVSIQGDFEVTFEYDCHMQA